MNRPIGHTPGPWMKTYVPYGYYPGWHIYQDDKNQLPVATCVEPQGGRKNKLGRSPRQTANAQLVSTAPELLYLCKKAHQLLFNGIMQDLVAELSAVIEKAERIEP